MDPWRIDASSRSKMGLLLALLVVGLPIAAAFAFRRGNPTARKWLMVSLPVISMLGLGTIVAVLWMISHTPPESGEKLGSVGWLDSRASDISYFRANDFTGLFVYEFRISEPDFMTLAKERGWTPTALPNEQTVARYSSFLPPNDRDHPSASSTRVRNGWIHQDRRSNGGGITVVYDSSANRAYVSQSSR